MRHLRIIICLLGLLLPTAIATPQPAHQTSFPSRPITLIVPYAADGPTDLIARTISPHMALTLRQPILIENVAGAGGTTGSLRAMRAAPNGYMLVVGHTGTHAAAPVVFRNLGYDPATDFTPVGLISEMPVLIVGRKDLPANTAAEFMAYAKEHPLRMGHAGIGSVSHTFCSHLNALIGATPKFVAFNGTGPAMQALAAGDLDYMCDQIVTVVPQLRHQTIKAYAISSRERSPSLPDIPTAGEVGLAAFQGNAWNALFAPKGLDPEVVKKINAALGQALDAPATKALLTDLGGIIPQGDARTPKALADLVQSTISRLRILARQSKP